MYKVIGLLGASLFSIGVYAGETKEAVVQVNSDITVSCYFTVRMIKREKTK